MHDDASRLVDDDQPFILIDDIEFDGFGQGRGGLGFRHNQIDPPAGRDA